MRSIGRYRSQRIDRLILAIITILILIPIYRTRNNCLFKISQRMVFQERSVHFFCHFYWRSVSDRNPRDNHSTMSSTTAGKVITCKAPVCWGPKKGQTVVEVILTPSLTELKIIWCDHNQVEVDPPKKEEVRVKIAANGVCRSDAHHLDGDSCDVNLKYPCILGHEASGVVESVGPGVTSVSPGDHVVLLYAPQCLPGKECERCRNPKTNACSLDNFNTTSVMRDGTTRFRHNGQTIYHYCGVSTFSEYTVCRETQVAKVNSASCWCGVLLKVVLFRSIQPCPWTWLVWLAAVWDKALAVPKKWPGSLRVVRLPFGGWALLAWPQVSLDKYQQSRM